MAKNCLGIYLCCQMLFEMLEDQPVDQVSCWCSLPYNQDAVKPTEDSSARTTIRREAPLHFGHQGG